MNNKQSKNSKIETTIFTEMSALSQKYKAVNLGQGFPNFDCPDELKKLVSKHMDEGKNQYVHMAGVLGLRQSICDVKSKLYNCTLDPEKNVCVTAGGTQALFTAILALISSGDEVIIIEPAYDSYRPSIEIAGGIAVPYQLSSPDFDIDWDELESLITNKTKMIIINSPQNPTGRVIDKQDITALDQLINKYDLYLLSDEVYHHIVFDEASHESSLKYPSLFHKCISVFSFGKTFHVTGWKIGYCVGPEQLMLKFKNVHQWNVFSVNSFIQYALAEFLMDENNYNSLARYYEEKRDKLVQLFAKTGLKPLSCQGTYFQIFDYSELSQLSDREFAIQMLKEKGVASIPTSAFYHDHRTTKTIRICFAKTTEVLKEAAARLT